MSEDSTPTIPYVRFRDADSIDEFSLRPNYSYKVAHNEEGDPTLYRQPAGDNTPSKKEASELDRDPKADGDSWFLDGTELTLVTQEGETPLEMNSHFCTDADKSVHFPDRFIKHDVNPYIRCSSTLKTEGGLEPFERREELLPNHFVKVDVDPSHGGYCMTEAPTNIELATFEMAW